MRTVTAADDLALPPLAAMRLWTDTSRWPTFVPGFSHVVEKSPDWPEPGSKLIWQSTPAGRGRVTERVLERTDETFVTQVFEERLAGTQSLYFAIDQVVMRLEYELTQGGPLHWLTDVFFIRRALTESLIRTLRRFSTEAEAEASL
jgi:hypothetical protein